MKTTRRRVSVIIPVRDDAVRLATCLDALEAQDWSPEGFEVIVVDNNSTVSPADVVAARPHARLISCPTGGSYAARNAGWREARGDIIAFTDSDCVPDPRWLTAGVGALTKGERIGLVAGRIDVTVREPRRPHPVEAYEQLHGFPQRRYATALNFGATANVFTWRHVLEAAGPFDADLRSGGDKEWGARVHAAGFDVVYSSAASVRHPARTTVGQLRRKLVRVLEGEVELRARENRKLVGPTEIDWWRAWVPPVRSVWRARRSELLPTTRARLAYGVGMFLVRYLSLWINFRLRTSASGRAVRRRVDVAAIRSSS